MLDCFYERENPCRQNLEENMFLALNFVTIRSLRLGLRLEDMVSNRDLGLGLGLGLRLWVRV